MTKSSTAQPMFVEAFPHATHDFYKPSLVDVGISDWSPSLTRQEFAEECDINTLMSKYEMQIPPWLQPTAADYVDWTDVPDNLLDTLDQLKQSEASFMRLPAQVRREFENDPLLFVDYASDPTNLDQLRAWGLAKPAPAQERPSAAPGPSEPSSSPAAPAGSPASAPAK